MLFLKVLTIYTCNVFVQLENIISAVLKGGDVLPLNVFLERNTYEDISIKCSQQFLNKLDKLVTRVRLGPINVQLLIIMFFLLLLFKKNNLLYSLEFGSKRNQIGQFGSCDPQQMWEQSDFTKWARTFRIHFSRAD